MHTLFLDMDWLHGGIFLLLVTALNRIAFGNDDLNVRLEPTGNIKVCEEDSVKINCTFRKHRNYKVTWHYNVTNGSRCNTINRIIKEETNFTMENTEGWSTLTIPSIRTTESGWYFCKVTVDIPVLKEECSDGLLVLVANNISTRPPGLDPTQYPNENRTTTNSSTACSTTAVTPIPGVVFDRWWIWIVLAVACVLLIVLVVLTWMLSRRSKELIYENTTPRNSTGWRWSQTQMDSCQLPASKKVETIKPLRKYDSLPQNRIHRL